MHSLTADVRDSAVPAIGRVKIVDADVGLKEPTLFTTVRQIVESMVKLWKKDKTKKSDTLDFFVVPCWRCERIQEWSPYDLYQIPRTIKSYGTYSSWWISRGINLT